MAATDPAGEGIARRLQEAVDRLHEDIRRVEIWAGAMSGFAQPVPGYDQDPPRHVLPPARD